MTAEISVKNTPLKIMLDKLRTLLNLEDKAPVLYFLKKDGGNVSILIIVVSCMVFSIFIPTRELTNACAALISVKPIPAPMRKRVIIIKRVISLSLTTWPVNFSVM